MDFTNQTNTKLDELKQMVERLSWKLEGVTIKRIFNCDAFYYNSNMFAIIWKTGRVGLKITNEKKHKELSEMEGTSSWIMGSHVMDHWTLVPSSFHQELDDMFYWMVEAYRDCGGTYKGELTIPAPKKKKPVVVHHEEAPTKSVEKVQAKTVETPKTKAKPAPKKAIKAKAPAKKAPKVKAKTTTKKPAKKKKAA